jgi:hypothetical protein
MCRERIAKMTEDKPVVPRMTYQEYLRLISTPPDSDQGHSISVDRLPIEIYNTRVLPYERV